jgi:hypothetical protein
LYTDGPQIKADTGTNSPAESWCTCSAIGSGGKLAQIPALGPKRHATTPGGRSPRILQTYPAGRTRRMGRWWRFYEIMNATIAVQSGMPSVTLSADDFCHDLIVNRREASEDIFDPAGFSGDVVFALRSSCDNSNGAPIHAGICRVTE